LDKNKGIGSPSLLEENGGSGRAFVMGTQRKLVRDDGKLA